ncbi:uncharacterized protein DDB_G0290685-like [Tachysurus fulvidraco]|uniref:uncharacterized protein DDB_G0290685-like n=1 Tax=Tachysurus fulvidraco TaxID=1234273 RepID=UPI000F4FBA8F|nr:uncharacterized protein DDB_G0290685-like [Tachysurus fulvidraco]XP_027016654.1 uncharacterized protein DDB_G0290685-like [Tachysurus fulvidraco]
MPRSKEIPEDVRRQVVEAHESGKGYKQISKVIGLPKTTIRGILRKWKRFGTVVTLPRSGRPSKISPRARREIIREVMKNPCTTSRDLQATLASSNICVHQSTIRRILGIHGRPTLSSFEGNMPLSNKEEGDMHNASCGSSHDVKAHEQQDVLKSSNTNSDNASKNKAKLADDNKEGAGPEENNREDENENCDDEMPSRDVGDADGGYVETASTNNNGGETKKCDDDGDAAEKTSTNTNSSDGADENKKCVVETAVDDSSQIVDAGYTTGCDVNGAFSNNNNDGTWTEEIDYISTLTFT